jgi:hypothetical protein
MSSCEDLILLANILQKETYCATVTLGERNFSTYTNATIQILPLLHRAYDKSCNAWSSTHLSLSPSVFV